ncbi:MAG: hypothetical protein EOO28_20370 [Comamonadaceae bacterium]|nr:MAG: hypothetical protein EOO28_20370 [Comamonadaceae bacterium]
MNAKSLARLELLRIAALLEKQEGTDLLARHELLLVEIAASLSGEVAPPSVPQYAAWCDDLSQSLELKSLLGVKPADDASD